MKWFSKWLNDDDKRTFDQDLEILIARWTNHSRKKEFAMTIDDVGERLLDKAERILDRPKHGKKHK